MMRVLTFALSMLAASVAADHGTETVPDDQNLATTWAEGFMAQIAPCLYLGGNQSGPVGHVIVSFEMTSDIRPIPQSIRLVNPLGQSGEAQGFEAARRAILRCGQPRYDLPLDLFSQWQFVEISFPYFVTVNE